uniref:Retinoblastoma binding protein 5 n=1 Tax=Plectus sambesii TaxID=2011161 RepID=A0A914WLZ3_9BILA
MNLELLESFGQNFPEESDGYLDCISGNAICCKFNRWGSLLAAGCNDGRVVIFDFITRGIAKVITAHVQPVSSLSWSRNGRKLLTASNDSTVAMWNVLTGDMISRYRFPALVTYVQFRPRDEKCFLVCTMKSAAVLVDSNTGNHRAIPSDDEAGPDLNVVAVFDRRGQYVLTGNGKGKIAVFDADTLECVTYFRQPSNHPVKTLTIARRGQHFVTNSGDRVIRVYDLREVLLRAKNSTMEPVQKLQDMVNKTSWKTCCMSGDGDYICAGSAKSHALYIWEKNSGSLVKILHGTKGEMLLDVQWHPCRPLICSVSNGIVSVWAQSHVENWSAFAPDFKELDENVKYEERESEFDLEDEDRSVELNQETKAEDEEVDVVNAKPPLVFCSSDEEDEVVDSLNRDEGPLLYLPTAPEIEAPEETPYVALPAEFAHAQTENKPPLSSSSTGEPRKHKPKTFDVDVQLPPGV